VTYTQQQVDDHHATPCPGCGNSVDQDWLDVTDPPNRHPKEFVSGRWTCRTVGCEYGPPHKPDGCVCPYVDVSTFGDHHTRWLLGNDPKCAACAEVRTLRAAFNTDGREV
jgi:hypothetical protein